MLMVLVAAFATLGAAVPTLRYPALKLLLARCAF